MLPAPTLNEGNLMTIHFAPPTPTSPRTAASALPGPRACACLLLLLGAGIVAACEKLKENMQEEPQEEPLPCKFAKTVELLAGELVREPGNPWKELAVTITEAGTYDLDVDNDGMAGFAVFTPEGEQLLSANTFDAHPTSVSWTGELPAGELLLRIRLAGKPGTSVHYRLSRKTTGDGPTLTTAFTVSKGEALEVALCGGLSRMYFGADALADGDVSVDFIAHCTARECIEEPLASDRIEVTTIDDAGYVFKRPPALVHPRLPRSVRTLDEEPVHAVEGAERWIDGERLVEARSLVPHFSVTLDRHSCGGSDPVFQFPFEEVRIVTNGNHSDFCPGGLCTHKGDMGEYAVDFGLPLNTPTFAVTDGPIYWRPNPGGYGENHLLLEIGPKLYYRYGHCEAPSPALIDRGLIKDEGPVTVTAGEVVCLSGDEGAKGLKPHFHGDLVEIADISANTSGGASRPHGYLGNFHGTEGAPLKEPVAAVWCSTDGTLECLDNSRSLQDECVASDGDRTKVERAGLTCEAQAKLALTANEPFYDLTATPDHPANHLRLAEATNQIYVGSPAPDCPFRPTDVQTRIETAKVLLTAAAGDSGILASISGYFDTHPECRDALAQQFADYDAIIGHWGRDVLAYTSVVCGEQFAFFEGRLHDDKQRYADLDEPILAVEAAKLLVELGSHETIEFEGVAFAVPMPLRDLYNTFLAFKAGEQGDQPFLDNLDVGAWYVDYVDALGFEKLQCPDPAGKFGVFVAEDQWRRITREEVAGWLDRVLLVPLAERNCG